MVRKDEAPPEFIPPEERIPRTRQPPPSRGRTQWRDRARGVGRGRQGTTPRFEPYVTPRNTPKFEPFTTQGYADMGAPQTPALPQAITASSHRGSGNVAQQMIDEIPPSATSISRDPRKRPEYLRRRSEGTSATLTSSPTATQPSTGLDARNTSAQVPLSARSATHPVPPHANPPAPSIVERQPSPSEASIKGKIPRFTSAPAPVRIPASKPLSTPPAPLPKEMKKDSNRAGTPPAELMDEVGSNAFAPPSDPSSAKFSATPALKTGTSSDVSPSHKNSGKVPLPVVTTVAFGAKLGDNGKKFKPFSANLSSNQNSPKNKNGSKPGDSKTLDDVNKVTPTETNNISATPATFRAVSARNGGGNRDVASDKAANVSQKNDSAPSRTASKTRMEKVSAVAALSGPSVPAGNAISAFATGTNAPVRKVHQFLVSSDPAAPPKLQSHVTSKPVPLKPKTPLQRMAAEAKAKSSSITSDSPEITTNASKSSVQPIVTTNMVQMQLPSQRGQVKSSNKMTTPGATVKSKAAEATARLERDRRLQSRRSSLPTTSSSTQRLTQTRLSFPGKGITPPPRRNANPNIHRMVTTANVGRVTPANIRRAPIAGLTPAQVKARSAPTNSGLTQAQVEAQAQARTLATKSEHARAVLDAARAQQRPGSIAHVYPRGPDSSAAAAQRNARTNTTAAAAAQRTVVKIVQNRPTIQSGTIVRSGSLSNVQDESGGMVWNDQSAHSVPQSSARPMSTANVNKPRSVSIVSRPATTAQTRSALGQSVASGVRPAARPIAAAPPSDIARQPPIASTPASPSPTNTAPSVSAAPAGTAGLSMKRGRGRPRGSKTKNPTGRPRGRPKKPFPNALVPTVTSIGTPSPPTSAMPAPAESMEWNQEKKMTETENRKAMSFLAMRGKKRMFSPEPGPEQQPAVQQPPTHNQIQNQQPEQLPYHQPEQEEESNPLVKKQKVAHVLQSLEGPNVAPKRRLLQMLQFRPRNLAVSIAPGNLTASYLLARTSSAGSTGISIVPSKKKLGLPRYVSRGTTTTPDLEQPELRSGNLGLANRPNVAHVDRRSTQAGMPAGGNRENQLENDKISTPIVMASNTTTRPVVRQNAPTALMRQNSMMKNVSNASVIPKNIAPSANARPPMPPVPPPGSNNRPKSVTMRTGPKEVTIWKPIEKVMPASFHRNNLPYNHVGPKQMTIWKPVHKMIPPIPVNRPGPSQPVRQENRIWKNAHNLAAPVNRNVTQQSMASKLHPNIAVQNMPHPVTNRDGVISNSQAAPGSAPHTFIRKPIQKAKKNHMLKSAIMNLMVQQKEAQVTSKRKGAPLSTPPTLRKESTSTSPPRRKEALPTPPVRRNELLVPDIEDEIVAVPVVVPAHVPTEIRERNPIPVFKGPVSTLDVRTAMERAVVRKESGLSARKNTAPEYKAMTSSAAVKQKKFGCWCDEPVNQVPAHLMGEIVEACQGDITPLDLWRWRVLVHERVCANASRARDAKRSAMLRSFESQPFAALENGNGT